MSRTGVPRLGENLAKKLGEIRKVLAEEVCLQDKGFPGVIRAQLATEQLGLANDAQSGPSFCALQGDMQISSSVAGFARNNRKLGRWQPALKANSSNPTVRPGRGSYLVPALATMARRVVGPLSSREATLTPAMVVGSYDALGEATAANPRCASFAAPWRRRASWLPLVRAGLQIMVEGPLVVN